MNDTNMLGMQRCFNIPKKVVPTLVTMCVTSQEEEEGWTEGTHLLCINGTARSSAMRKLLVNVVPTKVIPCLGLLSCSHMGLPHTVPDCALGSSPWHRRSFGLPGWGRLLLRHRTASWWEYQISVPSRKCSKTVSELWFLYAPKEGSGVA